MNAAIPLEAMVARADRVTEIVAPQYDTVARGGRYRFAAEHPDCFINVTLSVADFPAPVPGGRAIARRAASHFEGMLRRRLFEPVPGRGFFLYELDTGSHRQQGIVAGLPVSAIREGRVVGHEGTIDERVDDLARFFRVARLASNPVSLGFRADEGHVRLIERLASTPPLRDFTGEDGVRQRLWTVAEPADVAQVMEAVARIGTLYITDGHHRVAASSQTGVGPGWFLAILFPTHHLAAAEYNRVLSLDQVPAPRDVFMKLGPDWEVTRMGPLGRADARPGSRGELALLLGGFWYRLQFRGKRSADPVSGLDVSLLHDRILGPGFGVSSYQDPRLSFVAGGGSLVRLERRTAVYPGRVGFAMRPAQIVEIVAVADAGRLMPPKSTWFTPKPRSGLFVVRWDQTAVAADTGGGSDSAQGAWL